MTEQRAKISARHFLRIPGLSDERPSAELLVDGSVLSVVELVGHLSLPDSALRSRAIDIIKHVSSPSRGEIHTIANGLFCLAIDDSCPDAALSEVALNEFLSANARHPEALSIGSQLLRIRNNLGKPIETPSFEVLLSSLKESLLEFPPISSSATKQNILETRYVLLRAFEVPQLSSIATRHISSFLADTTAAMATERKAFAGQFLSTLRTLPTRDDAHVELTRMASCVFATGFLSPQNRPTPPPPPTGILGSTRTQADAPAPGLTAHAAGLLQKLLADERYEFVPRLMPQDFQVLRQVTGLKLEVFRLLTERIRRRAASDPWARAAILDLVRSPHEPQVTARVRTAVLGALVNDARRAGKLSTQLEKEVFAISAEIPDLPFLTSEPTDPDEHEDTLTTTPLS